ncbi:MAG TPA: HrcA family transcriptional regulator, partial [Chloroflexota bacterium]|nr:HrcA family transcriptional regulator [Chloroflexota bacterium]
MDNTLSERQQAILALIVREHVTLKAPVGSDAIVRKYCPRVSPATVRHEMVTLASHGYVFSTHPSSGRVPTHAGYRFYVRHLMRPIDMPADERRMINHQFHQIERDLDQWSQLAATVLAQLTGYASFVTPPLMRRSRLRHVDLVATQDRAAMLLALLREGTLHRQLLTLDESFTQARLDEIAHYLTRELHGKRAEEIREWSGGRAA